MVEGNFLYLLLRAEFASVRIAVCGSVAIMSWSMFNIVIVILCLENG